MKTVFRLILSLEGLIVTMYVVLFSIGSLCLTALAALQGSEWSDMSHTAKVCVILAIIGNWATSMAAFFNRSWSRVQQGKPIVGADEESQNTPTKP